METLKIITRGESQIPCTVCKEECLNKGWHLANANFCSIGCMCDYIENINLIFDEFEQKIKILENKIKEKEMIAWKTSATQASSTKSTGSTDTKSLSKKKRKRTKAYPNR